MGDWQAASWWGVGVAVAFVLDWAAVALEWKALKPFSKPLAMVMVVLWTAFSIEGGFSLVYGFLLAAQVCGLVGDILLLFPEKAFSAGLGAFLAGHLIYLGLMISTLPGDLAVRTSTLTPWAWLFIGFVLWVGSLAFFYWLFKPLRNQQWVSNRLWAAIQVYSWVLSGMVVLTLITGSFFSGLVPGRAALLAGALLFLISDSMLTYDRFIQSFTRAQLWVRISYHLAQFSLAWGFLFLFG
jgi:uncharacterized membrane protein YhhN